MTTLGKVARWGSGGTPKRSEAQYFGAGIPWLSISDLNDGEVTDAKESLTQLGLENSSAKVVPAGTLLVAMYGSIGKLGIAGRELCTSQAIAFAQPDPLVIDIRYLFHFLLAERTKLQRLGRGGTQMNIGQADLKSWPIPLPPLSEQRRIAAILDQAGELRAKRRVVLAQLDSLTQAIFIDMFGSPSANPKGYPLSTMRELVDPKRPITYGILKPGPDLPDGVPYIRVVDMTDRSIHRAGLRRTTEAISSQYKRSLLREGDLLLSIRGHVGRLAMVEADVAGANITQDTARLAITGADPIYVLECLRSPELQRWMKTFTKGAAVRGINLTDVKRIQLPLPPASDQSRFARAANDIQRNRQSLLASAGELDLLFASLQHRAFRGEL